MKIDYLTPEYSGWSTGKVPNAVITDGDWNSLYEGWRKVRRPWEALLGRLEGLEEILLPDNRPQELVGFSAVKGRVGDALKGLGIPGVDEFATALLGGKSQSDVSKFEAEARIILAEIAPIFLGESGRTISDADRIRVALALGFKVDADLAGKDILQVTGFDSNFWTNPDAIQHALNTTAQVVNKYILTADDELALYMAKFDKMPDTAPEYEAVTEEQREKSVELMFKYDLT